MLQVQQDGKLLVTPESQVGWLRVIVGIIAKHRNWFFVALAIFLIIASIVQNFFSVICVFFMVFGPLLYKIPDIKMFLKAHDGGLFVVETGAITHVNNTGTKTTDIDLATHDIKIIPFYEHHALCVFKQEKNQPKQLFVGITEPEARAMKACLEGRQIGLNKKSIKMQA